VWRLSAGFWVRLRIDRIDVIELRVAIPSLNSLSKSQIYDVVDDFYERDASFFLQDASRDGFTTGLINRNI
jgi:hypothetical protein